MPPFLILGIDEMTIKDIARLSGYSIGTVSRALNNHPDVSDKARQRILQVVKEQGFQPNSNAKHLKQQNGAGITVIVKGTMNMLFAELVEKMQILLDNANWDTSVYYIEEDENEIVYADRLCHERKPMGIIFLGGDLNLFREGFSAISVPCVLLTNTAKDLNFHNLSSFTTDDINAAEQIVELLVKKGHRNIAFLGGNIDCSQITYRRLMGCKSACEGLGVPFDIDRQCEPCRYDLKSAYSATYKLIEHFPEATVIFAVCDIVAMGAIRALRDMGKRVPEDISVVGFDGIPLVDYLVPRLMTIRQDTTRLAERGVDTLLQGIIRNSPPVHELVPFKLTEGESVGNLYATSAL